jgi:iron(III) transport system permease protein
MLELPISQILSPPGDVPLSVAITKHLEGYDFGGGGAMTVLAVLSALVVIGVTLTLARWFVPGVGGWGGVR